MELSLCTPSRRWQQYASRHPTEASGNSRVTKFDDEQWVHAELAKVDSLCTNYNVQSSEAEGNINPTKYGCHSTGFACEEILAAEEIPGDEDEALRCHQDPGCI